MKCEREPFSLQDTWAFVGTLYAVIVVMFGVPMAIAEMLMIIRRERHEILRMLGPAEALARRVLLLRALSLPAPNCAPKTPQRGMIVVAFADNAQMRLDDQDVSAWRCAFKVWPYGMPGRKNPAPEAVLPVRRGADLGFNAFALARRLEALRRVLEDPRPAVARLVRLLAARRETAHIAFGPYRPPADGAADALYEIQEEIALAFNTS